MASLSPIFSHGMRSSLFFLFLLLAPSLFAMGDKPEVMVRFFLEANEQDTEKFAVPITLNYPSRKAFIERVSSINERMIKAVYPFQAHDGSWGCTFLLDDSGRLNLEVLSTERRGSSIVAFIGNKKNSRQVIDMSIDKPIKDGIISIPRGLTELEIAVLVKAWPVLGKKKH
jgi:hypothetical protein